MSKKYEVLPFNSPSEETLNYEEVKDLLFKSSPVRPGHDEVSLSDIRHWCEVMQDPNPLYADTEYARNSEYGGPIAPPAMVQTWSLETMKTALDHFVHDKLEFPDDPHNQLNEIIARYGYSGVMATQQEQIFLEPLRPGDTLYTSITVVHLSEYDHFTRQGVGRYYTIQYSFSNQDKKEICRETFRVLMYKPPISSRRLYKG